jgi:Putative transposase
MGTSPRCVAPGELPLNLHGAPFCEAVARSPSPPVALLHAKLCLHRRRCRSMATRPAPAVQPMHPANRGLSPPSPSALAYDKPLCAALDGFTLHAATRAGAHHAAAREALLRYVLRPPIAKERAPLRQDGLVRLSLKRAFSDGTIAVDMDPLSLLCRLAESRPPPRFHTVKHAGVLASASRPRWRASASARAQRSRKSLRRRTMTPLRNAGAAAIGRGPSAARLRSMSSRARPARGG